MFLQLTESTKLSMDHLTGSNAQTIKRKYEDMENDINLRLGKLHEIKTKQKATRMNEVSSFRDNLETRLQEVRNHTTVSQSCFE